LYELAINELTKNKISSDGFREIHISHTKKYHPLYQFRMDIMNNRIPSDGVMFSLILNEILKMEINQ
jgi:hypothetical protein